MDQIVNYFLKNVRNKQEEEFWVLFSQPVKAIFRSEYYLVMRSCEEFRFRMLYLPPVAVKQLLVENCPIGTQKVNRVKVGWVNRILKWYNILDRNDTTGDIRQDNHDSCHIPGDKKMFCQVNNIISSNLQADAVLLALCGRVRVVTTKHQTVAGEPAVLERKTSSV